MAAAISVIIPAYNRAQFVSETVRSVLDQTFRDFEVLVIDDGSTDATAEVLREFTGYQNFHYEFQENLGRSKARNQGIQMATGKYLIFLDSDDILEPDALESFYAAAIRNPTSGVIGGGWGYIDTAGNKIKIPLIFSHFRERNSEMIGIDMIQDFYLCIGSYIIRTDVARSLNGFDSAMELAEDYDFYIRFCGATPITFFNKPIVRIRRHQGNTSTLMQYHSFAHVAIKNIERLLNDKSVSEIRTKSKRLAMWYFRLGDDFYNSGQFKSALRNYLRAVCASPFFVIGKRPWRLFRQILASSLPASLRRTLSD